MRTLHTFARAQCVQCATSAATSMRATVHSLRYTCGAHTKRRRHAGLPELPQPALKLGPLVPVPLDTLRPLSPRSPAARRRMQPCQQPFDSVPARAPIWQASGLHSSAGVVGVDQRSASQPQRRRQSALRASTAPEWRDVTSSSLAPTLIHHPIPTAQSLSTRDMSSRFSSRFGLGASEPHTARLEPNGLTESELWPIAAADSSDPGQDRTFALCARIDAVLTQLEDVNLAPCRSSPAWPEVLRANLKQVRSRHIYTASDPASMCCQSCNLLSANMPAHERTKRALSLTPPSYTLAGRPAPRHTG